MAATAIASWSGETGTFHSENNRLEVPYKVFGATNTADAALTTWATAPATVVDDQGQVLNKNSLHTDFLSQNPAGTSQIYDVGVLYVPPSVAMSASNSVRIEIDTSGGSQHITQSISSIARYPTNAANFQGAIGVTADGSVEGTDIGARIFEFTITKTFAHGAYPDLSAIAFSGWHTNSNSQTFTDSVNGLTFTLAAGECLFKGARIARQGSTRADGALEVTYAMAGSPNLSGLTIGSITGIAKKGFEHVWVRYAPDSDGTGANKVIIQRPLAAYVEKVFEATNLAGIGL